MKIFMVLRVRQTLFPCKTWIRVFVNYNECKKMQLMPKLVHKYRYMNVKISSSSLEVGVLEIR